MKIKKKQSPHKNQHHHRKHHDHRHHVQANAEIHKAVAQAWLSHTSSDAGSRPLGSAFDVHRISFQPKPSRFKIEAIRKAEKEAAEKAAMTSLDFNRSLLDMYEIVAVSRRLERGLVLDHEFSRLFDDDDVGYADQRNHRGGKRPAGKRRKGESNNSLRNLFSKLPPRNLIQPQNHNYWS